MILDGEADTAEAADACSDTTIAATTPPKSQSAPLFRALAELIQWPQRQFTKQLNRWDSSQVRPPFDQTRKSRSARRIFPPKTIERGAQGDVVDMGACGGATAAAAAVAARRPVFRPPSPVRVR